MSDDSFMKSPECVGQAFSKFKVQRPDGSKFSNADFKNKVVFVTFWQEPSPTCMKQIQALNEMFEKLKDRSNFVFVLFCPDSDSTIRKVISTNDIRYNFLRMSGEECNRINHGFGFPSSFILNKKGKIVSYTSQASYASNTGSNEILNNFYSQLLELL
ncbi:MAG: redoxin domain-containing protein [Ferruginibacter sp.]